MRIAAYLLACSLSAQVTATEYQIKPDAGENCQGSFSRTVAITAPGNGLLMHNAFAGKLTGVDVVHPGLFPAGSVAEDLMLDSPRQYQPTRASHLRRRAELAIPGAPLEDFYNQPRNTDGFASVGAIE